MSQASIETRIVDYNSLGNLSEENIKPGLTIRLEQLSQADQLVTLLTQDISAELAQRGYAQYQADLVKTHGKSVSELILSSSEAKRFQAYPFRGQFENWNMLLLPTDLSFVANPEGVIAETAASFALYGDAVSSKGGLIGEISRTYTLYVRNRRNGPQKEPAPYLMVSSKPNMEPINSYMGELKRVWHRALWRSLSHPVSGGLPSLGKRR